MVEKHTDSVVKKQFWPQQSVGNVMQAVFWGIKRPIPIDLHKKNTMVNSSSKCLLIWQNSLNLLTDIHIKLYKLFDVHCIYEKMNTVFLE